MTIYTHKKVLIAAQVLLALPAFIYLAYVIGTKSQAWLAVLDVPVFLIAVMLVTWIFNTFLPPACIFIPECNGKMHLKSNFSWIYRCDTCGREYKA